MHNTKRAGGKNRKYFAYENFEISLDDIEGLEPYMEVEIALEDGEDYSEAQNSIFTNLTLFFFKLSLSA